MSLTDQLAATLDIPSLGGIYEIADEDFDAIRRLAYEVTGISLSSGKRSLVCSRLAKRLRALRLRDYGEYVRYLTERDPQGHELQRMVNCLTTNKTEFFREPHHFDFLREVVFPAVQRKVSLGQPRRLRIWSAGCSTGNEAYSIAITILEHFGSRFGWDIKILASDIDTEVIKTGEEGIYPADELYMPNDLRQKYFLRGTGRWDGFCQAHDDLRQMVRFRRINLIERPWPHSCRFDVIFCRNTIIYFDTPTQQELLPRLASRLQPGGFLMLGHSENLPWITPWFTCLGNTVHQLRPDAPGAGGGAHAPVFAPLNIRLSRPAKLSLAPVVRARHTIPATATTLAQRTIIAGETFASKEPIEISTTLGSCVAACLYDPASGIGGMNHFMLPGRQEHAEESARYGVHAMELLINEIMKLGGDRRRLQAKAFGGSNLMPRSPNSLDIGASNIEFVRHFLETERIPLVAERLGGTRPMRVLFLPHTGQAYLKVIDNPQVVVKREAAFARACNDLTSESRCAVTLF